MVIYRHLTCFKEFRFSLPILLLSFFAAVTTINNWRKRSMFSRLCSTEKSEQYSPDDSDPTHSRSYEPPLSLPDFQWNSLFQQRNAFACISSYCPEKLLKLGECMLLSVEERSVKKRETGSEWKQRMRKRCLDVGWSKCVVGGECYASLTPSLSLDEELVRDALLACPSLWSGFAWIS